MLHVTFKRFALKTKHLSLMYNMILQKGFCVETFNEKNI